MKTIDALRYKNLSAPVLYKLKTKYRNPKKAKSLVNL